MASLVETLYSEGINQQLREMTTEYILNKIESKARTLDDTSCLVVYCFAKFYPFISKPKILEAINKGAFYRGDKKYKSPFSLQN